MYTRLSNERPVRRARAASRPLLAYGAAVLAACAIAIGLPQAPATAGAENGYRLSGPYTQKNLSFYLIHREGRNAGPAPITLGEAMRRGLVKVVETGSVSRLMVRNLSDREVFIQSGDIVKGGKQDRVLVASLIVPPKSGYIPIGAFCVEQGRWARRGKEMLKEFSVSASRLPSRAGKIAIMKSMRRETPREARYERNMGDWAAAVERPEPSGPDVGFCSGYADEFGLYPGEPCRRRTLAVEPPAIAREQAPRVGPRGL